MATLALEEDGGFNTAYEHADGSNFQNDSVVGFADSNTTSANRGVSGIRFVPNTMAQGATINSAAFKLYSATDSVDNPYIDIFFEDVDDANDFNVTQDVLDRVNTTATIDVESDGIGFDYVEMVDKDDSADVRALLQEVVDRGSYVAGNEFVVLVRGKSALNKTFRFLNADHPSVPFEAQIDIDYTNPAGGSIVVLRRRMEGY